jgi:isopentenyl-diphosphate delta-isomerase
MTAPAALAREEHDSVILVDVHDAVLGFAAKLDAHRRGQLHRAVSVVVFDERGRMLLQRRAPGKYHSAGLWSNTCCGHPRPGETVMGAAHRRLIEELGIDDLGLERVSQFVYRAEVGSGLVEHELDHVLIGQWNGDVRPNPLEVSATRWVEPPLLFAELRDLPGSFTAWTRTVVSHACPRAEAMFEKGVSR